MRNLGTPTAFLRLAAMLVVTLASLACGDDLPKIWKVRDLRVLAIKADPPEFFYDGADPKPDVTFSALVVNPNGDPVVYGWSFCPVESNRACLDFDDIVARLGGNDTHALREARHIRTSGIAERTDPGPGVPTDERLVPYELDTFTVTAAQLADIEGYLRDSSFYGFGTGAWPSAILNVQDSADSFDSEKREVVGLGDLGAQNALFRDTLGLVFCDGALEPGEEDTCVPFDSHVDKPNTNPVFESIEIAQGKRSDATFRAVHANETVRKGKSVRIRPNFTAASSETYQLLRGDVESRQVTVDNLVEDISVNWFVSAGTLQDELTWPKFTKTLDTVFTAPDKTGVVTVWMVARDQRGGTEWAHVDLTVTD